MKAIEFKHVYFKYNRDLPIVLNNVNFEALYSKITLLSGMSGSGKSTIISLLSGIIPNVVDGLVKGEILVNGNSVKNRKLNDITRDVGLVLQNADSQIIQNIVSDEIAFGCENIGLSEEEITQKILEVTKIMSLDPNSKTRYLSGGGKERLIASAILAMGQKIIILDEPLANLDKKGSIILLEALKKLRDDGYAILIVEHRLDMILSYVDVIYHIENGEVKEVTDKDLFLKSQIIKIENEYQSVIGGKLIELDNICYKVKNKDILKNIIFTINKGEKVVLLGENGCGKTTTSKIISKIIKPSSGIYSQYIDSKLKRANKKWFKHVGVIYQNPNYQLFMPTVYKEIEFSAKNKEVLDEVISLFKLENILSRHPQSLSEGQKRKLTVATVLATLPDLIILDEPTVGQDYESLKNMVNIINYWHHKYNNTIITITHDIRCVDALCDKAIWIDDGCVKKIGGAEVIDDYFNSQNII